MTNWSRIVVCCLVLLFVVLSLQSVDAKRSNKIEKIKDRQREEKRHIKKEGKKIKKSFSKKYEQLYFSLCPDCYSKLLQASESCSQNYEKLELVSVCVQSDLNSLNDDIKHSKIYFKSIIITKRSSF